MTTLKYYFALPKEPDKYDYYLQCVNRETGVVEEKILYAGTEQGGRTKNFTIPPTHTTFVLTSKNERPMSGLQRAYHYAVPIKKICNFFIETQGFTQNQHLIETVNQLFKVIGGLGEFVEKEVIMTHRIYRNGSYKLKQEKHKISVYKGKSFSNTGSTITKEYMSALEENQKYWAELGVVIEDPDKTKSAKYFDNNIVDNL